MSSRLEIYVVHHGISLLKHVHMKKKKIWTVSSAVGIIVPFLLKFFQLCSPVWQKKVWREYLLSVRREGVCLVCSLNPRHDSSVVSKWLNVLFQELFSFFI